MSGGHEGQWNLQNQIRATTRSAKCQQSWQGSRLRPLRARLARGQVTPTDALSSIVGREQAERIVLGLRRARLRTCAVSGAQRTVVDGRVRGRRFASLVRLDAPLRAESARAVVGPVRLLLTIIERAGATGRVWHRSMWLGEPDAPADRAGGLASIMGVGVRELERWLGALRTLECVRNWQPPTEQGAGGARNACGRAYSVYQLPAFSAEFTRWRAGLASEESGNRPAVSVEPNPRRAPTELVARFLSMVPQVSDSS